MIKFKILEKVVLFVAFVFFWSPALNAQVMEFEAIDLNTEEFVTPDEKDSHQDRDRDKKRKEDIIEVASLDVRPLGVDNDLAESLSQILASRLGEYRNMKVISKAEMKAMIGFEFEKKAMGCTDDIFCLAEVGGAMGSILLFRAPWAR